MNTHGTYKREEIDAYLLGALTDARAEFLDELSFTDDEFADRLKAAEKDLIDAYVRGELAGAALEKFESFYLATPLRREKTEFARAFQIFAGEKTAGLRAAASEAVAENAEEKKSVFFAFPRFSLQWGLAFATVLLLLFGGWLFLENSRLRDEMSRNQADRDELSKREAELFQREKKLLEDVSSERNARSEKEKELVLIREEREKLERQLKSRQPQERQTRQNEERAAIEKTPPKPQNRGQSVLSFVLSPSLRSGGGDLKTLSIPPETDSVRMRLELESDDYASYRAALKPQTGGAPLWQSGVLKTQVKGESAALNVGFPARLLKSQNYSLEVSGITAGGASEIISDYSFRVVR